MIFFGACWLWGTGRDRYYNKSTPSCYRKAIGDSVQRGGMLRGFLLSRLSDWLQLACDWSQKCTSDKSLWEERTVEENH